MRTTTAAAATIGAVIATVLGVAGAGASGGGPSSSLVPNPVTGDKGLLYTASFTNDRSGPLQNVAIVITLPDTATSVKPIPPGSCTRPASNVIRCSEPNVPVGGTVTQSVRFGTPRVTSTTVVS